MSEQALGATGADPAMTGQHTAQARVNKHKADWRGWKFMWPFAVVFVFVFIIPIVYAIYISFFKKQMIGGTRFVGLENYSRLLVDQQFWSSVGRVA
ncbi:ABC transporter permease, partial [Bifidobacterium sp. DSM 109959]|nr:ABC transporter permease [Bifidobacterium sp. DSM 109959]